MHRRTVSAPSLLLCALLAALAHAQPGKWSYAPNAGPVQIIPREECSFAQAGGKFYLLGGRGLDFVQEYSPAAKA